MKYTVLASSLQDTDTEFIAKTAEGDALRIVQREDVYKIRRIANKGSWQWDLSVKSYGTLEEAKEALLSGDVRFKLGG